MNKFNIGDAVKVNKQILTIEHVYYSKYFHCYMYTFICYPYVHLEDHIEEL